METAKNSQVGSSDEMKFFHFMKQLLNLRADADHEGTAESIKANIEFKSANAWTLVFAIFIASIGLNVNSTAVIIGAMLISPLMGPIIGVGFALGTHDFLLLKKSAKNLAAAVIISLLTSMLYFLISPLSEVQSELLARTRPSFFDVLIAFFGGAAGIVAISRKEKSNAVPGVAIATALMPPLCTAGFGLATGNWSYVFGALYLFIINSVFISISTFLFVRYLQFKETTPAAPERQRNINRWITYVAITVIVPSFFMAWYLQQESFFRAQAAKFIRQEVQANGKSFVVDRDISYSIKSPKVRIYLLGETLSEQEVQSLKEKAENYMISSETIEIQQSALTEKIEKRIGEKVNLAQGQSERLHAQIKKYEQDLTAYKEAFALSEKVTQEMSAIFPGKIAGVYLIDPGNEPASGTSAKVLVQWLVTPGTTELNRSRAFLEARLGKNKESIQDATIVKNER